MSEIIVEQFLTDDEEPPADLLILVAKYKSDSESESGNNYLDLLCYGRHHVFSIRLLSVLREDKG